MQTPPEKIKEARHQKSHPHNETTYPSMEHLAREIGVRQQACYAAIRKGLIPHIRIGRGIILPRSAISQWLKNTWRELRNRSLAPSSVTECILCSED